MRGSILLITFMFTIACGTEGEPGTDGTNGANCYDNVGDVNGDGEVNSADCVGATGPQGPQGPQGPKGDKGDSYVPDSTDLSGFYLLENNSTLELVRLSDGTYNIVGSQALYSENKDQSAAKHPRLPTSNLKAINGIIVGYYNANYQSSLNVKDDATSTVITGYRLTMYKIYKDENSKLVVELTVHDSSGVAVATQRTIKEE